MRKTALTLLISGVSLAAGTPGSFVDNQERTLTCEEHNWDSRPRSCEVREQTIASTGSLHVDAGMNGGVSVKGWSGASVLVRAKVEAEAESSTEAKALASAVSVQSVPGDVRASGPEMQENRNWSVSYEIFVPHMTNLEAKAFNGGMHVTDIGGTLNLQTQNGGLHLARLKGDVKGMTQNGGVHVELMGDHWDGRGLDVSSTNGGVHMAVPTGYSAQVESTTVNGGIRSDFPELVTPAGRHERQTAISAALGGGGATVRATTVNGGISVVRND